MTGFNGIKLGDGKIHLLAMSNKWSNTLIHVHMCNKPWWEKSALVYYTSVMSHYVIKLRYLYPNTLEIGCARFKYPSLLSKFCLIYHGIWYWNDLPKNSSNARTHILSLLSFQLDKEHNTPHCRNPFPPHRPSNTILAIFPPIFTQYDDLVRNLKNHIEKENAHVFIPLVKNIIPCIDNGSPT